MILAIEIICILAVVTIVDIIGAKKNSLLGLHNFPATIQERVRELPEYKDMIKGDILTTKQRIIRKLPALLLVFAIFYGFIYLAGANSFVQGFLYSFILWVSIKLYVTLFLQCIVLYYNKKLWISGTEDLENEWRNRKFFLSSIPRSIIVGVVVSLIMGVLFI